MWELPDCLASTADRRCAGKPGEARKDTGMSTPAKLCSVSEPSPMHGPNSSSTIWQSEGKG